MICIVAGTKTATDHEYEKCVSGLFETILIMRLTDSMKGFLLTTDVDGRLTSLEQNMKDITDKQDQDDLLIRRILDYLERNDPYRERKWYSSRNV
jgi:PAS domain-containing protein